MKKNQRGCLIIGEHKCEHAGTSGQRSEQVETMSDMNEHRMGDQPPLNVSAEIIQQSEQAWKRRALEAETKLKRYEEREPLVQRLVGLADPPYDDGKLPMLRDCGRAVRYFKLE